VSARQLTMFGVEPRLLEPDDSSAGGAEALYAGTAPPTDADDGQIELFAPAVVLGREMDAAIAAGRFEVAARLRSVLDRSYGPSPLTRDLGFLDQLGACPWEDAPAVALSAWTEVDARFGDRPHLRARLREGVFGRLLASHAPDALVEARPECLPMVAAALDLRPESSAAAGRRRARALVRDALLAGRDLSSLDFAHDQRVADLLAEEFSPRWLACLGLIRRLWTAPRPGAADLLSFSNEAVETPPCDDPALEFWRCLQVAECGDCLDRPLHEARRRMKRLQPGLHALYMRRGRVILTASGV